jgi:hypothetical protein
MSPLDASHEKAEVDETAVTNGLLRPKVLFQIKAVLVLFPTIHLLNRSYQNKT